MAHTLSLTDGTTTLNLAEATVAGYHFVSYGAPRPNRKLARVSGFPFADGSRTVASSLDDVAAEFVVNIVGTTADNLDARFQTLILMLEAAQRWEEQRIGSPVRLTFARQGVTQPSYRVVTGVPLMPEPIDTDINWLDLSSIATELTVSFTLTLAPVTHTGAMSSIASAISVINSPGNNAINTAVVPGDMPAPLAVIVTNTSGVTWSEVWIAELGDAPIIHEFDTIVDATASGAGSDEFVVTSGTSLATVTTWAPTTNDPVRAMARIKVTAGTPGLLELRFALIGGTAGTIFQVATWVAFPGVVNEWALVDLGPLLIPATFTNRANQDNSSKILLSVEARSRDGSSVTIRADYIEFIPIRSFVKLRAAIADTQKLIYESVARHDTFVFPLVSPDQYVTSTSAVLVCNAERFGVLHPLTPGDTPPFWIAMHEATRHTAASDGTVSVQVLPSYSIGLRGAV